MSGPNMDLEEVPAAGDASTSISSPMGKMLRHMEQQVNHLLEQARRVQQERDSLLETLLVLQSEDNLKALQPREQEVANATCEALVSQCLGVDINIDPGREPDQEVALHMVNNWIDQLIMIARQDPAQARVKCESYVHTLQGDGLHDEAFFSMVTNCASLDRESLGSRLSGLLKYIDYMMTRPFELE